MLTRLVPQSLDKIMALNQVFRASTHPDKINLIIGAYRDRENKPYVFDCVKRAAKIPNNYEYSPIEGDSEFLQLSKELYFGKQKTYYENIQTLSGTGALKLTADFLVDTYHENYNTVYLPNPTWGNHSAIFQYSGLPVSYYNYLDHNRTFNINNLAESIRKIPNNNIILLHACAHNPSGYDPSEEEWKDILNICQNKNLFIIVDFAYFGFSSGDLEKDSILVNLINKTQYPSIICCSYAKNFGLYNERVGNLFFTGNTNQETQLIKDTMKSIIRKSYSSPPSNGANIIKNILKGPHLTAVWKYELKAINDHYTEIRNRLKTELENKTNKDFSDITKQSGMFYYSRLTPEQVLKMRDYGIFFPDDGRISLAGINAQNINYIINCYSKSII